MQPLIYKQRIQRWGFRQSMFVSLIFHATAIFGVSFVVIQQPWEFKEEAIVNIKFANGAFDMEGRSFDGRELIKQNSIMKIKRRQTMFKRFVDEAEEEEQK